MQSSPIDCSIELVHPEGLWWWIREEGGKRKNRAVFRIGNVRACYDLAVTDPLWLEKMHSKAPGIYPHSHFCADKSARTLLTVSLSEAFEGFHYKLVAGVIHLME